MSQHNTPVGLIAHLIEAAKAAPAADADRTAVHLCRVGQARHIRHSIGYTPYPEKDGAWIKRDPSDAETDHA